MSREDHDQTTEQHTDQRAATSRRQLLRGTAATGVAVAALGAGTTAAAAQWWGSSGVETFELSGTGAADQLPNSSESELVVYLHGAGVGDSADTQGQDLEDGLADAGYDTTVVAGLYEESDVSIGGATSTPAENLADLIEDYQASGGTARIVGYSLGGILTMQTLNALTESVPTAATFGTGTPDSTVCEGEVYHDGIETNTDDFRVYYSEDDSAIQSMNAMQPDCASADAVPTTLTRIDVTESVSDHLSYLDSTALMEDLAASFDDSDGGDGGTDGGDGDGGDDGSFWW